MKYQPSANEKANRVQSNQLPVQPPRINRSQSANDAAAGVYGSAAYAGSGSPGNGEQDARYYYSSSGAQTYPDAYGYDAHGAYGYHQYAAEQAPNDEAAAYHQYHAQQAAMQHAQQQRSQHTLAPIYDNAAYNPGYYNTNAQAQAQAPPPGQQQRKPPDPYDRTLYSPYTIPSHNKKKADIDKNKGKNKEKKPSDDTLPTGPTKLKHAATVGDYYHQQLVQSTDLRFELEEVQNKKNLKRVELENKRKKLLDANALSKSATKELEETKKKWNLEREEIIKSYGGKIPSFIIESDKLRRDLENMSNRNSALQASLEVISSHLQSELYQLQYQLKVEKEISGQTHEHNIELQRRVRELRIEKLELETELKTEKDKEDDINLPINNITTIAEDTNNNKFREYPPESTVIQNLLQAQVEFYFSDYNLKRDKRLLCDVVKPPKKGFLKLEEVMKLSRIRQLCSEIETLEEALRRSTILTLIRQEKEDNAEAVEENKSNQESEEKQAKEEKKEKETMSDKYEIYVGRVNFEKPREKEFPFRRTVFIFGIPVDSSAEFLHAMLKPFGSVSKIQFDHSPDGIDRKIGIRFLNKPRVYKLYYYDPNREQMDDDELLMSPNREEMIFKTSYDINSEEVINNIKCHKCGKDKAVSEGFYTTMQWKVIYCAQCAAQLAEDQLNVYYKERNIPQYQHNPRHKWLGAPPNDIQKRKTALVVFASQRQASKCAYVRTRIAYKGAFATHFHHYSKVKKEIVLSESDPNETADGSPQDKKQKQIKQNNNKSPSGSPGKQQIRNNYNKQRRRQNSNRIRGRGRGRGRVRGRGVRGRMYQNQNHNQNNRYGQNQNHMNYAQQQAAFYAGQQAPQVQQMPSGTPKIYRQSSAPSPH